MVDRVELFEVADTIVGEGKIPSTRTVRERLKRKGSFSDVAPVLLEWSVERNYRPRPTQASLPVHLTEKLTAVAIEVWNDGHREGTVAAQNELGRLVAERDALKTALVEALTMADYLDKTVKLLAAGVPAQNIERSQQRGGSIAFWKSVVEEISNLLGDRSLTAAQIIMELNPQTVLKAKEIESDWCPANLADRLRGRVRKGRYFAEPAQGVFCRLDSPNLKTAETVAD